MMSSVSPARGDKSSTDSPPADLDEQLARVADALYALKPDDFAAARDAEVRSARDAGQQPLAREIARLRKPTQSAWLVNLLWRDQHDVMEQLFELAYELSQAQADAAGPALRELTAQRRQIENSLVRRAVELGTQAGVRVSDSVAREAQETLSAALARPEVAEEVRSGRLVKPASYVGFGALPTTTPAADRPSPALIDLDAARQRRAAETQRPGTDESAKDQRADDQQAQREAAARERAEAERRQRLERAVATARAAAERAKNHLEDAAKAADEAHARVGDLRQQLDTLRAQLQRLESDVDSAEARATQADQRKQDAESENVAAIAAVKAAEKELTE
jgi:hypothetical protein